MQLRARPGLNWIEDQGLGFVADVPADLRVWEQGPAAGQRPKNLGRAGAGQVGAVAAAWRAGGPGKLVTLGVGENGPMCVRVWVWAERESGPRERWLVVRQYGRQQLKHSLLNAPATWLGTRRVQGPGCWITLVPRVAGTELPNSDAWFRDVIIPCQCAMGEPDSAPEQLRYQHEDDQNIR